MIRLDRVRGNDEEDGADDANFESEDPPRKIGEIICLYRSDDAADERDDPRQLGDDRLAREQWATQVQRHTMAMEIDARAKGSPMTFPMFIPLLPY